MVEAEADTGTEKGADAAAFTSFPRWDYALSLIRPEKISRVFTTLPPETASVEASPVPFVLRRLLCQI